MLQHNAGASVTSCDLLERENVARVELNCALEISQWPLPASLAPLDETRQFEYPRIIRQESDGQLPVQPERHHNRGVHDKDVTLARGALHPHPDGGEMLPEWLLRLTPTAQEYGRSQRSKAGHDAGELAIRLEKRWIARHRLVQQIDCLQQIGCRRYGKSSSEIDSWREYRDRKRQDRPLVALNGQFLSGGDFGVKLFGDFLRDLTLDCEQIIQIAVVLFRPNMSVGARVD